MDLIKILTSNGVEQEAAETVEAAIKSQLHKEFIPKLQYNKKIQELDSIREENDDLKARVDKPNEFEEKYNTLNQEFKTYKSEITEKQTRSQKENLIKEQLKEKGFTNGKLVDLMLGKIDFTSIELEENTLKGFDVTTLETEFSEFKTVTNTEGAAPSTPPATNNAEKDLFAEGFGI